MAKVISKLDKLTSGLWLCCSSSYYLAKIFGIITIIANGLDYLWLTSLCLNINYKFKLAQIYESYKTGEIQREAVEIIQT